MNLRAALLRRNTTQEIKQDNAMMVVQSSERTNDDDPDAVRSLLPLARYKLQRDNAAVSIIVSRHTGRPHTNFTA